MEYANAARSEFQSVLRENPNDRTALASLASLAYQEAQGIPKADDKLKPVFDGKAKVNMFEMNKHLAKHLK